MAEKAVTELRSHGRSDSPEFNFIPSSGNEDKPLTRRQVRQSRAIEDLVEDLMKKVEHLSSENEQLRNLLTASDRSPDKSSGVLRRKSPSPDPFNQLLAQYLQMKDHSKGVSQGSEHQGHSTPTQGGRTQLEDTDDDVACSFCLSPVDETLTSEANDISQLLLAALFRDKQFKKFIELLELLEKGRRPSQAAVTHMVTDALKAYLGSQDFHAQPDKLVSALQAVGCSFPSKMLLPSEEKRRSAPPSPTSSHGGPTSLSLPTSPH